MALDASGNVWMANQTADVSEFSNAGVAISPSSGYTGALVHPTATAIDGSGNVWVPNEVLNGSQTPAGLAEFSLNNTPVSPYYQNYLVPGLLQPHAAAIDGSGDIWVSSDGQYPGQWGFFEFIGLATPVITPICAGLPATPTSDGSSNLGTRP